MTNDTKSLRNALLALLVGSALLLTAPAATAGDNGGSKLGELRVLDDRDDRLHDPVVTCEFEIVGLHMPAENGTLVIKDANRTIVLNDTWEANQDGNFVNGPYTLDPGSYGVKAFYEYEENNLHTLDNGHDGKKEAAAPVRFVVEECPEEPEEPVCPTGLDAEALGNGDVRLTWTPAEGANATLVYRSEGDQDAERVAVLDGNATSFVDTDTVPGTTYTYEVRHAFGEQESEGCDTVEVTAIPVFPTVLGAVAASTVGILAYAGLRRRL